MFPDNRRRRSTAALVALSVVVLACVVLQALTEHTHLMLRYDRAAIEAGQWWRMLTGQLLHLGWPHVAMNLAGLAAVYWLFARREPLAWFGALAVCATLTGLALYLFSPGLLWYVGLSALLHGLVVAGAIGWVAQGDRAGWAVLVLIGLKIIWEQQFGALPLSEFLSGGPVAVDAHLWGGLSGAVIGLGLCAGRQIGQRV